MAKYHSTMSRREFMKVLGLGSAGLGAAAIAPPVFHDLDEAIASPTAVMKRPSWVKEVDKPTTEIDWSIVKRFDYSEVMWANGLRKAYGPVQFNQIMQLQQDNRLKRMKEGRPGYTLRDDAFVNASYNAAVSFLGPTTTSTPEQLGVPRWQGTPEENARMVRAFLRFRGASEVGFVELESNTTEKLIYAYDTGAGTARGKQIVFADVKQAAETDSQRIIPRKARWVIVYTIRMADEFIRRAPTPWIVAPTEEGYNLKSIMQGQLQLFLRTLGYMGLGESTPYNSLALAPPLAIMAGLGEQCRIMHCMTPERGVRQRIFKVITDLPLAPGKPVDFGVMKFCRVCKKCADFCPVQAYPHDTDPNWEIRGPYNSPGVRIWRRNEAACNAYMRQAGYSQGCLICFAVCPLSKGVNKSIYQGMVRTIISKTPVLDRAFRKMDDFLGYGDRNDPDNIWNLDLPPFGWD
jgi:epoxyqueuosine reductase